VDEAPGNNVPALLRTSVFMDYGNTWLIDRPAQLSPSYNEWGTGFGFFVTAGQHFTARLTVAWALNDVLGVQAGSAQAYFSVGYQF
jgi:hemolysin activation/secretion protein